MKKLSYIVGEENARELKGVLRDLNELHDRLATILGDCEEWANKYGDDSIHDPYGPIGEENIGGESGRRQKLRRKNESRIKV